MNPDWATCTVTQYMNWTRHAQCVIREKAQRQTSMFYIDVDSESVNTFYYGLGRRDRGRGRPQNRMIECPLGEGEAEQHKLMMFAGIVTN